MLKLLSDELPIPSWIFILMITAIVAQAVVLHSDTSTLTLKSTQELTVVLSKEQVARLDLTHTPNKMSYTVTQDQVVKLIEADIARAAIAKPPTTYDLMMLLNQVQEMTKEIKTLKETK